MSKVEGLPFEDESSQDAIVDRIRDELRKLRENCSAYADTGAHCDLPPSNMDCFNFQIQRYANDDNQIVFIVDFVGADEEEMYPQDEE